MAPFSSGSLASVIPVASLTTILPHINKRSLGSSEKISPNPIWSASKQQILIVLALFFASISVASSTVVFYWFIKMRRSFRHDLIMLLIQSDMFKALWYMSYPLVFMVSGPVRSESTFCQISGFFLTVGIEQSDVAVLIIAVHSALFIFKDKPFGKEEGLYPYRYIAYGFWLLSPLIMASLAFLDGPHPYVVEETYCYLRVRPFWYQLALGWIPRYFIFIIILGTYGSIYCYVRHKFHSFSRNDTENPTQGHLPHPYHSSQPAPSITHSLMPNSSQTSRLEKETTSTPNQARPKGTRSYSTRSMITASFRRGSTASSLPIYLNRSPLKRNLSSPERRSSFSSYPGKHQIPSSLYPGTLQIPPALYSSAQKNNSAEPEVSAQAPITPWLAFLVRDYSSTSTPDLSQQSSGVRAVNLLPNYFDYYRSRKSKLLSRKRKWANQTVIRAELIVARDRIQRQLRFLFIYPMIYLGMWIVPFISHSMQFESRLLNHPPFSMTCVTTVSICIQAFVDCWLFSTREKPWRHIPGNDGSFWGSFKFWTGWTGVRHLNVYKTGPGKTRDEMVREARDAYQRRDDELAQRRNRLDLPAVNSEYSSSQRSNSERTWWDFDRAATDLEAMNSVEEEVHVYNSTERCSN